jgi:hypothetical protein
VRSRRGSERRGELGSLVGSVVRFQMRDGGAAGEAVERQWLRSREKRSICFQIDQAEGFSRCVRERENDWEKREGLGLTVVIGIKRQCLQRSGAPASYCSLLEAFRVEGRKGDQRGDWGVLLARGSHGGGGRV